MRGPRSSRVLSSVLCVLLGRHALAQVSTTLTYQGELKQSALPATGTYDFQFRLYSGMSGTDQVGPTLCRDNVGVTDGRFTTPLDFGNVYSGTPLFVELAVRADTGLSCANAAGFVTIGPRQEVTVVPFAAFAGSSGTASNALALGGQTSNFFLQRSNHTGALPSAALSGTYSSALTLSNASNVITGVHSGSGAALTALNAANLATGVVSIARGGTGGDTSSAVSGQVLKFNGSAWTPGPDLDTNYGAGAGLQLLGGVFSVPTGGITSLMVADNTLTSADIATNTIGSGALASDAVSFSKVTGNVGAIIATNMGIGATPLATAKLNVGGNLNATGDANVVGTLTAGALAVPAATRVISVPMMAFYPFDGTSTAGLVTVDEVSVSYQSGSATDKSIYAPIYLPNGAIVTQLHGHIEDASNTDLTVSLLRRGVDGSGGSTMATLTSSGNIAGTRIFSDTVIGGATIDNNTFSYMVKVDFRPTVLNPNPPILHGIRVMYTVTAPLP